MSLAMFGVAHKPRAHPTRHGPSVAKCKRMLAAAQKTLSRIKRPSKSTQHAFAQHLALIQKKCAQLSAVSDVSAVDGSFDPTIDNNAALATSSFDGASTTQTMPGGAVVTTMANGSTITTMPDGSQTYFSTAKPVYATPTKEEAANAKYCDDNSVPMCDDYSYPNPHGKCKDQSTPTCDDNSDATFSGLDGLSDSVIADVAGGAAAGSMLGPIGAIAGAAGGILSSIFAGSAQKDAAKAQAKALAAQKKMELIQVAAQQQQDVFAAQESAKQSSATQKNLLIGVAGLAALVIVGGLVYRIAKGSRP